MMYQAVSRYHEAQVMSAKPGDTILMLYSGAIRFLSSAAELVNKKESVSEKARLVEKAANIIEYLQSCLDMEKGGEIAANLDRLYEYMMVRLTEANLQNDGAKIDEVIKLLANLKEGWDKVCGDSAYAK